MRSALTGHSSVAVLSEQSRLVSGKREVLTELTSSLSPMSAPVPVYSKSTVRWEISDFLSSNETVV